MAHRRALPLALFSLAAAFLWAAPQAHAQTVVTGLDIDSTGTVEYQLFADTGPSFVEAFLTAHDGAVSEIGVTNITGTTGSTPFDYASGLMSLNFEDQTLATVSDPSVCSGCLSQQMNGTGTITITSGSTTVFTESIGNTSTEESEIIGVPGSSNMVIQLALKSGTTPEGYLILSGTTTAALSLCTPALTFGCGTLTVGKEFFNTATLAAAGWTATFQSTPYQAAPSSISIYLNPASLGSTNLSWSNNSSQSNWLAGSSSGSATAPPTNGDSVFLVASASTAASTVMTFDAATDPMLNSLTIDSTSGGGLVELTQAAGSLTTASETIGTTGPAEYLMTGGINSVTGTLIINGFGTYDLQGGTLNAGTIQVNTGGAFVFGVGVANFAALNIAGGSVSSTGNELLDMPDQSNTSYTVTQSAGSNTITGGGSLYMGSATGITGTYLLQAGTLNVAASAIIGEFGTADFQQSGGSVTLGSNLSLGTEPGAIGTYELSGSSATLSASTEYIGESGAGIFTQTAGTNTTTNLTVAANLGATGTYDLAGGTLNAGTIQVNKGGTFQFNGGGAVFTNFNLSGGTVTATTDEAFVSGTFAQSAGTNTVNDGFGLAVGVLGTASYALQGGTLGAQNETIGNFGTGSFTQSAGTTNTVAGTLLLAANAGDVGTYELKGGMLSAGTVLINAGGTFLLDGAAGQVQVTDTLTNNGSITSSGTGDLVKAGGNISSEGTVTLSGLSDILQASGDFTNGGTLTLSGNSDEAQSNGNFINNGTLTVSGTSGFVTSGGNFTNAGTITLSGYLSNLGVAGSFANNGTLTMGDAVVSVSVSFTNAGMLTMQGTGLGQLGVGGTFTNQTGASLTMSGSGDTLTAAGLFDNYGSVSIGAGEILNAQSGFTNEASGVVSLSGANNLSVTGTLSNSGSITIGSGSILSAGTYHQLSGLTLLNGGTLDPTAINIDGGSFGGTGTVMGNVTVTGATTNVGGAAPGSLHVEGNFTQTGGTINFTVGSNGMGEPLLSSLVLDPGTSLSVTDATILFDFAAGSDPLSLLGSAGFNLDALFLSSGGGSFLSEANLASLLGTDTFEYETPAGVVEDLILNSANGDFTPGAQTAASEPATPLFLVFGLVLLVGAFRRSGKASTES